ncbi:saccharopine dehydrogenase NADP-binding domain-containing protein [Pseudonocardia bannensis]|uniref:NAD(P)H-binding protein n=1 Tax=Pseudonocardia bannensis TaxID=630973 RepID=A0A848DMY6_9PSEU|nr:saccharopine dehydrogenase NADP-binding domain-containing protein [Pseudonocardia bannensis]NMH93791.1 NAD(P)H-binding protein [Pseudonocardia bannensis]
MTGKIVLFGATGYTGGRTAEAMAARGLRPVLAGRDPARLARLAERLGGFDTARADVTDAASVRALVERGDVLVTTVGPFAQLGGAALAAAVDAGAIYLDSTGEPPFVREVFELQGPAAERSGAALLTAFGNDYVPGVLAGALALRAAGRTGGIPARVDVGYFITGGGKGQPFSRGTLESLIGVATRSVYAFRDGALRTEPAGARMRTFDVNGRSLPGVTIGATEQFALPRLAPGLRTVDVYLGWFGPASGAVHATHRLTPLLEKVPALGAGVTGLARLVTRRASDAPSPAVLAASTSHFLAEVFDAGGTLLARTRLVAPEAYAITADLLAWGAGRAAEHGVRGTGALDPVAAFGLDELVAGAAEAGIVERP